MTTRTFRVTVSSPPWPFPIERRRCVQAPVAREGCAALARSLPKAGPDRFSRPAGVLSFEVPGARGGHPVGRRLSPLSMPLVVSVLILAKDRVV